MNLSDPKQEKAQLKPLCLASVEDGARFTLDIETLIGREHECGILLNSPHISRYHAKISISNHGVEIEDLHSANGTYVNGQRIQRKTAISIGDELRFEQICFRLCSQSSRFTDQNPTISQHQIEDSIDLQADTQAHHRIEPNSSTKAHLNLHSPTQSKHIFALGESEADWTIGRAADSEIQLKDPSVSRRHAKLERQGESFVIRSLSKNKTLRVNGRPQSNALLKDGDEIQLGHSHLYFALSTNEQFRKSNADKAPALNKTKTINIPLLFTLIAVLSTVLLASLLLK